MITFFSSLSLLIIVIEVALSKSPFRSIDNDNFIKYDASVLKETVHLQKDVKQIIFKQIVYLKCEE